MSAALKKLRFPIPRQKQRERQPGEDLVQPSLSAMINGTTLESV
jgi:hypothetical protein